ncbi:MAG: alpha/beta fold hydrolase [Acidimicrobiales bacterium]
MFGTFSVPPASAAASVPGALILPSAGVGDRDGVDALGGVPDRWARDIAESLSRAGLASYRYDRRGTGESKIEPEVRLSVDDLVADARAGLDMLAQRKETTGKGLSVIGYDSGGLLALRLAALDERITRVVLIATPGGSLADTHAAQVSAQNGTESGDALRATVANLLATRTLPPPAELRTELRPMFPAAEAAFLADLYAIDPTLDAARLKGSVLIVVPTDSEPYLPNRLAAAVPNGAAQVFTTAGGPTLSIEGVAVQLGPNDPALHANGMSGPVPLAKRDPAAQDRITGFLGSAQPR